ncbi:MAG TPA: glycosyltransferase family 2 protein [Candidatus Omnitrophota bacterium]|nr:glycosyltransferase family 2 protein [Candidatus Omnitrophota bacterium]
MNKEALTISVIINTLNCADTLAECLRRIRSQDYPQDRIEIIITDGGSTDSTKEIGLRYGARIIDTGSEYRDFSEKRMYLGFENARNEILAYINSDNYLIGDDWFKKMVFPFENDREIIAASSWHYHYDKNANYMTRYFSLFGVNDPIALYLGKADKLAWSEKKWNLRGKVIEENPQYYKIRYSKDSLPTVGNNGFLVRRSVYEKLTCGIDKFFHIDANYDLVSMGYNTHAIVKTTLLHITNNSLLTEIGKRISYMEIYHYRFSKYRRYKVFDSRIMADKINIMKFVLFSLTLIEPAYRSIRGYLKIRDWAWFIHPVACLGFLLAYTYGYISLKLRNVRRLK